MAYAKGTNHPKNKLPDDAEFIKEYISLGPSAMARKYGATQRGVHQRRERVAERQGMVVNAGFAVTLNQHPAAISMGIKDGIVLVASDAHFWPGIQSTAYRAFVKFCQDLNPVAVIMNGDAYDGARVSRWPDPSWADAAGKPTVIQELMATTDGLEEIRRAAPKARHIWPLGNHDARFESRLLQAAPEYAGVQGVKLKDHFPEWEPCWAALINQDVVIKHRLKGGVHATHNNTVTAGRTIVTGHLHSLKVTPYTDYNGTRYGVDTGTLTDPYGPQFANYTELNPLNWRSGFGVLTFHNGRLLWPEVVHVTGPSEYEFRGKVYKI
jgi:hypothetical protein